MTTAINISDELVTQAGIRAEVFRRTVDEQIEYWARIGQLTEENPDLPFIQDILTGKEQTGAELEIPYTYAIEPNTQITFCPVTRDISELEGFLKPPSTPVTLEEMKAVIRRRGGGLC